jgi:hypothetical protein
VRSLPEIGARLWIRAQSIFDIVPMRSPPARLTLAPAPSDARDAETKVGVLDSRSLDPAELAGRKRLCELALRESGRFSRSNAKFATAIACSILLRGESFMGDAFNHDDAP